MKLKEVKLGTTTRKSFAKLDEVLEMPNLIEVQKKSYQWFIDKGLREVLREVSPITDYSGNLGIEFVDYHFDEKKIKYGEEECKERDANYAVPLHVTVRLNKKESGEIQDKDIFMGDFPKMTGNGTFIINGAERVVVSQIVRSPGMYYDQVVDKNGDKVLSAQIIPYRGAWLELETDATNNAWIRIDKTRKLPATVLLRALGVVTNADIKEKFGENEILRVTAEHDGMASLAAANNGSGLREEALKAIFNKVRPGEPATVETSETLVKNLFFDPKRYDLANVGRYKYNKKLTISHRAAGRTLASEAVSPITGELIGTTGEYIDEKKALEIERACINEILVYADESQSPDKVLKIISNETVYPADVLGFDLTEAGVDGKVLLEPLLKIAEFAGGDRAVAIATAKERYFDLCPKNVTKADIFAAINYLVNLQFGVGQTDDIDHLGNRRLRSVGELLQNQLRIGFSRMDKMVKERMTINDPDHLTPDALVNIRPIVTAIREFFGSSPLSQFMDQNNPLAELTHKRRVSALGPGGLSRDRASFEVRDVHYTHYGRMCPIETPEGPNIGLISYLSTYARINDYGFIETPYRKIINGRVTNEVVYMTADEEDRHTVAQANEPINADGSFVNAKIIARNKTDIVKVDPLETDYADVSPKMVVSVATSMIPFLESDDNARALMGSNMQKQAVPLMINEAPLVGTGMEYKAAHDSGVCIIARRSGVATKVTSSEIIITADNGEKDEYRLIKFKRSNQGTCVNHEPIINEGDYIEDGQIIADGPATDQGEISLGKNALIGFMTWEGYNYEDAVLLNERLVRDDVYTSIHIEEYSHDARDTKLGPEEITREINNIGEDALKDLDSEGIIRIGSEVRAGDILVGKVTPKGEAELTAEERLLRAIFGEKSRDTRDTSMRLPHGESGIVVDVKVYSRANGDELPAGVNKVVRVYIAQKRKISVGDKMAGRHGNKGVVSRILPPEDMPYLPDGTPLDIVLNPLGVPSRMNIGQVMEVHLGMVARKLGWKVMTPVFDGAKYEDIRELMKQADMDESGKTTLYDGRTGEPFDNPVTVGVMYYLKLHHLVDDKIHARSTGPYSLVTQQPLGGKAQFGGQRFGEMEVWALEAYGAAYTLQEILTVKSDDVVGRVKTYEAIVKGQNIPTPGVPESFKVLVHELQSLALDVKVLDRDGNEIELNKLGIQDDDGTVYVSESDSKVIAEEEVGEGNAVFEEDEFAEEEEPNFKNAGFHYDEGEDE